MPQPPAHLFFAATLTLLALSLSACAHNSPTPPAASLTLPPPPSLSTPLQSTSYSLTAAETIKSWQKKLMATQLMSAPSQMPGQ